MANVANQASVTQGQLLKGEVLDLRASQILVLLENGATISARTEGTLNLSIGQTAKFFVAQTTEDQILLKLANEDAPAKDPMIDKALNTANIQKTERSVSIVTELLSHQQPVNEATIRHYLSLSAKHPDVPVKSLILMELHHIPVTKENVEQLVSYQNRTAKLLTQAQDLITHLSDAISRLPEGAVKQETMQELTKLLLENKAEVPVFQGTTHATQNTVPTTDSTLSEKDTSLQPATIPLADNSATDTTVVSESLPNTVSKDETPIVAEQSYVTQDKPEEPQSHAVTSDLTDSGNRSLSADHPVRSESEPLLKDFLDSFLLEPEEVADPEKVQKYYDELNEKLTRLEQLSQKIAEQTTENNTADSPKQMRQNLSFMEAVNNVFPYLQLPLKFKETPAHGELYVYEKKKSLRPSDTLSALLHLELEALGTTDIFVTLAGNHVTTRFSMTNKESGDFIRSELPTLTQALAAKGYTLQSEVSVHEPSEENTPTLLEQFLEEHAPGGLNRYTFDIRA